MTGQSRPRGAYTATPCRSCRTPKPSRWYLCGACWAALPELARRALNKRDGRALARLRELHAHIDSGQPLEELEITGDQDRRESPFGWSDRPSLADGPGSAGLVTGVYGDPLRWDEVPAPLTAAVVAELVACGWTGTHATEHSIVVPLDRRAFGLADAAGRGEHLYVLWAGRRPEWSWGTAHPNAPAGGTLAPLLAPPDDPKHIAAQIIRILRTGRALP